MAHFFYNTDADSLCRRGRYPVLIQHGFAATSGEFSFGEQLGQLTPADTLLMYENGVGIVAVGRVLEQWDRRTHRPPIYYQPGDDGFPHEYRIGVNWFLNLSGCPIAIDELKQRLGYIPRGAICRIVNHKAKIVQLVEERHSAQSFLPEEVAEPVRYVEGASRQVSVNAYERNPIARSRCIAHYGPTCVVCGFRFGAVYGPLAEGFTHVHHIKPLSEIGEEYKVDPIEDLRPVCANCHAIIHLGGGCRSIEEARCLVHPRVLAFWTSFDE